MPALPISQQPGWNNNVYVLATTRILVMIGLAYLIKSLYTLLLPLIWGSSSASVAAVVADGIDLSDIVSDTPVMVPGAVGAGPDLEANLTLDIPPPQPSYDPRNQTERFRVNTRSRSTEVLGPSATAQTMPEQDVGVRGNDSHTEEGMHVVVGLKG